MRFMVLFSIVLWGMTSDIFAIRDDTLVKWWNQLNRRFPSVLEGLPSPKRVQEFTEDRIGNQLTQVSMDQLISVIVPKYGIGEFGEAGEGDDYNPAADAMIRVWIKVNADAIAYRDLQKLWTAIDKKRTTVFPVRLVEETFFEHTNQIIPMSDLSEITLKKSVFIPDYVLAYWRRNRAGYTDQAFRDFINHGGWEMGPVRKIISTPLDDVARNCGDARRKTRRQTPRRSSGSDWTS